MEKPKVIGTLRGAGGRGVRGLYFLKRPLLGLIMGIKAPYPPSPYPPKGPYDKVEEQEQNPSG